MDMDKLEKEARKWLGSLLEKQPPTAKHIFCEKQQGSLEGQENKKIYATGEAGFSNNDLGISQPSSGERSLKHWKNSKPPIFPTESKSKTAKLEDNLGWFKQKPGFTDEQIGQLLGRSHTWVSRHHNYWQEGPA